MKQTNRLLNISNILLYVLFIILSTYSANLFYQYTMAVFLIVFLGAGLSNLSIGIINLVKKNIKYGVITLIIAIMFIYDFIMIFLVNSYTDEEWIVNTLFIFTIFPVSLIIANFIINKKNSDISKKKIKTIFFILGIVVEVIIISIPIIINRINIKNIEKAISILKNDIDKKVIVIQYSDLCNFYDEEGNLISEKSFDLVTICDIEVGDENNINQTVTIIVVECNNQIWIVDYTGKEITRLYDLFEGSSCFQYDYFRSQGFDTGYINNTNKKEAQLLDLENEQNNTYKFGNIEKDGYQIVVELNENELETDNNIGSKKLESSMKYDYEEIYRNLEKLYKYKKTQYLINKNGETKKLDCNNLLFTFNKKSDIWNVAIGKYSNDYIPYYDNESTGFFDKNGYKISFKKDNLVLFTTDSYAIIYNIKKNSNIIFEFKDNKIEELDTNKIEYYDDKYVITDKRIYNFKNNKIEKIPQSANNINLKKYKLINIKNENKIDYQTPYDDNYVYDYLMEEESETEIEEIKIEDLKY